MIEQTNLKTNYVNISERHKLDYKNIVCINVQGVTLHINDLRIFAFKAKHDMTNTEFIIVNYDNFLLESGSRHTNGCISYLQLHM